MKHLRTTLLGLAWLLTVTHPALAQQSALWVPDGSGGSMPWLSPLDSVGVDTTYGTTMTSSATGTGNALLACLASGGFAETCAAGSAQVPLGLVVKNGGVSTLAEIAVAGTGTCIYDNARTEGNYVQLSSSTDGKCHDAGASFPTNGRAVIGTVTVTTGSPANGGVFLSGRGAGMGAVSTLALTSDATTNSTTTGVEITGLNKTTGVGTFTFKYVVRYQSAATTTGVKFGVNHTGTATAFMANMWLQPVSSGSQTTASQNISTPGSVTGASTRTLTTTAPDLGPTISVDTANADMLAIIEGLIIVTVSGDLELWHASEVAAASTVKAGTSLILTKTN